MKKILYSSLIALLVLMMMTISASAGATFGAKIIAGQQYYIGTFWVSGNADGSLTLQLDMTTNDVGGWCITDAAIDVATSLSDIPQNKGGAIPGKFDYKFNFGGCINGYRTIHIDKGDWNHGDLLYIAIHVNAYGPDGQQETGWAVNCGQLQSLQFPGKNWSGYAWLPAEFWY